MKMKTVKEYISPSVEICEMVLEAPVLASSVDKSESNVFGVGDGTFDDWGTL